VGFLLWTGLAVLVAAFVGGLAFVAVRGLALWRQIKRVGGALTGGLEQVARDADAVALKTEQLAAGSTKLEGALARLAISRAKLNVLLAAIKDVRDAIGRVTAVYPRK
jgi:hypothetical protein